MENLLNSDWIATIPWIQLIHATLVIAVGFALSHWLAHNLTRLLGLKFRSAQLQLVRKIVFFTLFAPFILAALNQLGFKLGALLGVTGVLTVGVGFAAKTSMANFISGLFLLLERPFKVGDVIKIGNTAGSVHSLDLFSIKLRTFDNSLIRIPNEQVLSSQVNNLTAFANRRFDLTIRVSYHNPLDTIRELLLATAASHPQVLAKPAPQFFFKSFGDSGIYLQLSVWCKNSQYDLVSNTLPLEVKKACDEKGIKIP